VTSIGNQYAATLDLSFGHVNYSSDKYNDVTHRVIGAQAKFYPMNSFYLSGAYKSNVGIISDLTGRTYRLGAGSLLTPRATVSFQVDHFLSAEPSRVNSSTSSSINLSYRF
jgi:hypothetical protein